MNRALIAVAILTIMPLTACQSVTKGAVNVAASLSGPTPTQARTLGQAEQAATLVTRAVDAAVNTGKLSRATLLKINSLSDAVHAALGDLQAANANNQSLNFAAFNAALDAWNTYTAANALPQ